VRKDLRRRREKAYLAHGKVVAKKMLSNSHSPAKKGRALLVIGDSVYEWLTGGGRGRAGDGIKNGLNA